MSPFLYLSSGSALYSFTDSLTYSEISASFRSAPTCFLATSAVIVHSGNLPESVKVPLWAVYIIPEASYTAGQCVFSIESVVP